MKEAIANSFRNPKSPQASLVVSATRDSEEAAWKQKSFEILAHQPCNILRDYLATRTGSGAYVGTVLQIDSNRAVQPVKFETLGLSTVDPDDESFSYSYYLSPFTNRWQVLVNNIYKKLASRDQKIAQFVKDSPYQIGASALQKYPDPFLDYQKVFSLLLPDKILEPIDPKSPREFHYRIGEGKPMPFTSLSSGEQEVVKVAFDLVWKRITHSVILVDEPELHLHPTLTFRLIETLKGFGRGTNQLILFTHSADLISTYYSAGNVFFIDTSQKVHNQAHMLSNLAEGHEAVARAAGANLGLFAVGKKLLFVEGETASVDRLVYHKVAQQAFPDCYIMPIGSVENLTSLRAVVNELVNSIFGIDMFMIRDRDGLSQQNIDVLQSNPRFRCLPRRHIENYLLDSNVLSEVAKSFYLPKERRDSTAISKAIKSIAADSIMVGVLWNIRQQIRVSGALGQPIVHDVAKLTCEELALSLAQQISTGLSEISDRLTDSNIQAVVAEEHERLVKSLDNDEWISLLPGKVIFNRFCSEFFDVSPSRVREAYVDMAPQRSQNLFADIVEIFKSFQSLCSDELLS